MNDPKAPTPGSLPVLPPLPDTAFGSRGGWRPYLFGGCGCLLAAAIGVAVVVALNVRSIGEGLRTVSGTMSELIKVRNAVVAHSRTPQVHVQRHVSGRGSTTLIVRVINSPLLADVPLEEGDPQAREIARVARGALPHASKHLPITVTLVQQTGLGIHFSQTRSVTFEADEPKAER